MAVFGTLDISGYFTIRIMLTSGWSSQSVEYGDLCRRPAELPFQSIPLHWRSASLRNPMFRRHQIKVPIHSLNASKLLCLQMHSLSPLHLIYVPLPAPTMEATTANVCQHKCAFRVSIGLMPCFICMQRPNVFVMLAQQPKIREILRRHYVVEQNAQIYWNHIKYHKITERSGTCFRKVS